MDVDDDWELLPDDDQIHSREASATVFQMNYFTPPQFIETTLLPAPINLPSPPLEDEFVDIKVESAKIEEKFDAEMNEKEGGEGLGVWKRGIGAICSFGVAVCIIVFTNNHNLHFRIYTNGKRMKTNSGVPIARARITVGGYYDASRSSTKSM